MYGLINPRLSKALPDELAELDVDLDLEPTELAEALHIDSGLIMVVDTVARDAIRWKIPCRSLRACANPFDPFAPSIERSSQALGARQARFAGLTVFAQGTECAVTGELGRFVSSNGPRRLVASADNASATRPGALSTAA